MDLQKLREPFPSIDIEWRSQQVIEKGEKVYILVLPYVTARAIMDRLDEVVGPENWSNQFEKGPDGGIICGIGVNVGTIAEPTWVWKWDGAENTKVEAIKGGLSSALKRAAVHWGIGRYLYKLDSTFAQISNTGKFRTKTSTGIVKWSPPELPDWALPAK